MQLSIAGASAMFEKEYQLLQMTVALITYTITQHIDTVVQQHPLYDSYDVVQCNVDS